MPSLFQGISQVKRHLLLLRIEQDGEFVRLGDNINHPLMLTRTEHTQCKDKCQKFLFHRLFGCVVSISGCVAPSLNAADTAEMGVAENMLLCHFEDVSQGDRLDGTTGIA